MKHIIPFLLMCMSVTAYTQEKADVIVSYDMKSRNWETDTVSSHKMTLLANSKESKFFNDLSLWSDSLSSTPEGKKQLQQIIMAACMTQLPGGGMSIDLRKGPVKKIHTYVFNNLPESKLKYYSKFAGDLCYYEELSDEMQWEISDSTMNILGYDCTLARSDYHGRKWDAWFTTEIPLPFGPWKFHGLPGLILKAESDNGISYTATGIEKTDRVITPMYSADDYQKTDRKKALAEEEYYYNNRESIIKAKFGGDVKFNYNTTDRPKYDAEKYAAEPDYKSK